MLDLQRESLAAQRAESSSKSKGKAPQLHQDDSSDDEDEENENEGGSASEHDERMTPSAKRPSAPVPMPSSGSIAELRARLHARMEALRIARGGVRADGDVIPGSKEALLEEQRLKRAGLREKRRQGIKDKKKEEAAKTAKKDKRDTSGKSNKVRVLPLQNYISGFSMAIKVELVVPDPGPSRLSKQDSFATVTFSKLTNTLTHPPTKHKKLVTSSDPHTALAQLEARSAKLAQLSSEKRAELEERDRLAKAEIRASGGKVYDDVSRLRKAIKKQDAVKLKSKKGWSVNLAMHPLNVIMASYRCLPISAD